jgi:TonB family protein
MIKASVVLVIAFCIARLLRNRAAAQRHAVWAAAIIAAAILPILTLLLPSWQPSLAQRVAAALPSVSATSATPNLARQVDVLFRADGIEPAVVARVWSVVWLTGSIVALLILGIGMIRQRWLSSRSSFLLDPELTKMTFELAREAGCRRTIRLRRSLDQPMPMTWGLLRPQILVPNGIDEWSDERKRVVIAHEVGHVQRLDRLFQMIAQIACAVYWFNPLFWMACNRLYQESEHACDDVVVNLGVDAREYASHLFDIARTLRHSRRVWSASLAMARPCTLENRFAALLKSARDRRAVTRKTVLATATLTLFVVLPLAAMRIAPPMDLPAALDAMVPGTAGVESAAPIIDQYTTPQLYSDEARARGVEGIVTVEVRVGVDGAVKHLHVVKGLGHGLDENALLAVRDWRFIPARRSGVPFEATTRIDVEFNLRTAELNEEIANDMATRIGPGVSPPQVVHRVEPEYLPNGVREKAAGAVVLDAIILEDGAPRIVRVIRSQNWELDEIAINALQQWKFSPAMKDGRRVKVRMNIAVSFKAS